MRPVQLRAALLAFLGVPPREVSPCTAARRAGQPLGQSCLAEPPAVLQVGKPVTCQGDVGGRSYFAMTEAWLCGSPGVSEEVHGMRRRAGQHFSQRHVHLTSTRPTGYNSKYGARWSSIVKSLPTPILHHVKAHACYRLKCIRLVDLF